MRILTLENECYLLNNLPDQLDEDIRFNVLDNSNNDDPDFYFIPLIFLESFSAPAIVMEIDGHEIMMPIDWHIAVGDSETGNDLEILPLTSLNDRGFEAFVFNPMTSAKPDFMLVDIEDIYQEVKWYFPKLKSGQILAVPLENGKDPKCAYFVKDISRQSEQLDYGSVW